MKNRSVPFFLLFLIFATARLPGAEPRAALKSDEEIIRELSERERVAYLERDLQTLEQLLSEEFTVNAADRVTVGRRLVLDSFLRRNPVQFSSFERTIEFLRVDGDVAVVMGSEVVINRNDSPDGKWKAGTPLYRRFTNFWRRDGGTWRLKWRQSSVLTEFERSLPKPRVN